MGESNEGTGLQQQNEMDMQNEVGSNMGQCQEVGTMR